MIPRHDAPRARAAPVVALLLLTSILAASASAQTLFSHAFSGGAFEGVAAGITLRGTVGEAGVVGRVAQPGLVLAEGFWAATGWRVIATDLPPVVSETYVNELRAPFPNPFRSSTQITYAVERPSPVRLSVHDVTGRLVAVLAAEEAAPGSYRVVWDGRDQSGVATASGVYFTKLQVGSWSTTRKMLKLR